MAGDVLVPEDRCFFACAAGRHFIAVPMAGSHMVPQHGIGATAGSRFPNVLEEVAHCAEEDLSHLRRGCVNVLQDSDWMQRWR